MALKAAIRMENESGRELLTPDRQDQGLKSDPGVQHVAYRPAAAVAGLGLKRHLVGPVILRY